MNFVIHNISTMKIPLNFNAVGLNWPQRRLCRVYEKIAALIDLNHAMITLLYSGHVFQLFHCDFVILAFTTSLVQSCFLKVKPYSWQEFNHCGEINFPLIYNNHL